jgi:hypothetical protein
MTSEGGGGSSRTRDVSVPRGQHPNTSLALQRVAQGKLESKFPAVDSYKSFYSKKPSTELVRPDILKNYNAEVKPQTNIKTSAPITVEAFLEQINKEHERRKPKSQQTVLTTEALTQHNTTPSKAKAKDNGGHHSPLGAMLGLD